MTFIRVLWFRPLSAPGGREGAKGGDRAWVCIHVCGGRASRRPPTPRPPHDRVPSPIPPPFPLCLPRVSFASRDRTAASPFLSSCATTRPRTHPATHPTPTAASAVGLASTRATADRVSVGAGTDDRTGSPHRIAAAPDADARTARAPSGANKFINLLPASAGLFSGFHRKRDDTVGLSSPADPFSGRGGRMLCHRSLPPALLTCLCLIPTGATTYRTFVCVSIDDRHMNGTPRRTDAHVEYYA